MLPTSMSEFLGPLISCFSGLIKELLPLHLLDQLFDLIDDFLSKIDAFLNQIDICNPQSLLEMDPLYTPEERAEALENLTDFTNDLTDMNGMLDNATDTLNSLIPQRQQANNNGGGADGGTAASMSSNNNNDPNPFNINVPNFGTDDGANYDREKEEEKLKLLKTLDENISAGGGKIVQEAEKLKKDLKTSVDHTRKYIKDQGGLPFIIYRVTHDDPGVTNSDKMIVDFFRNNLKHKLSKIIDNKILPPEQTSISNNSFSILTNGNIIDRTQANIQNRADQVEAIAETATETAFDAIDNFMDNQTIADIENFNDLLAEMDGDFSDLFDGAEGIEGAVSEMANDVKNMIENADQMLLECLMDIISKLLEPIMKLIDSIINMLHSFISMIAKAIERLIELATCISTALGQWLLDGFKKANDAIGDLGGW